jgi:hypothetical protein
MKCIRHISCFAAPVTGAQHICDVDVRTGVRW